MRDENEHPSTELSRNVFLWSSPAAISLEEMGLGDSDFVEESHDSPWGLPCCMSLCKRDNDLEYQRVVGLLQKAEDDYSKLPHSFNEQNLQYYQEVLAIFDEWYRDNGLSRPALKTNSTTLPEVVSIAAQVLGGENPPNTITALTTAISESLSEPPYSRLIGKDAVKNEMKNLGLYVPARQGATHRENRQAFNEACNRILQAVERRSIETEEN